MHTMQGSKLFAYIQMMRLDRPVGSLLLLWPTLWALWIAAEGMPRVEVLFVFVCGVVLMRSAGCVINDFADRHVDGHVTRTRYRPLVVGAVHPTEALVLFLVLVIIAFAMVLTQNALTVKLSFGALLLAAIYPFMKRITHLPQLFLGLAFSWAIPMAFAAQSNALPSVVWLLVATNCLWTIAYDTYYAMVDRDDDLRVGIKSTAILFGQYDKFIVGLLQLVTLVLLVILGRQCGFSVVYYVSLVAVGFLFVYQQHLSSGREVDKCFTAFLNNNYVGALVFIGIAAHYTQVG